MSLLELFCLLLAAHALAAMLPRLAAAAAKPVTVGFIYVGPKNDYGWNQSHAVGAQKIAQLVHAVDEQDRERDRRREDLFERGLRARDRVPVADVGQARGMEVPVPGVPEDPERRAVAVGDLADPDQHLGNRRARHGRVLQDRRRPEPRQRAERRAPRAPEVLGLLLAGRPPHAPRPEPADLIGIKASYPAALDRFFEIGRTSVDPFGTPGRGAEIDALFRDERYLALWPYRGLWREARRLASGARAPYGAAVAIETHCSMLIDSRIGATCSRMSRTLETPSSPCTAEVMPSYCSGSCSVIQIVCGMSSAVSARRCRPVP